MVAALEFSLTIMPQRFPTFYEIIYHSFTQNVMSVMKIKSRLFKLMWPVVSIHYSSLEYAKLVYTIFQTQDSGNTFRTVQCFQMSVFLYLNQMGLNIM